MNVDEIEISTVQDSGLIEAEKGQKRIGSKFSYDKGKNITIVCAKKSRAQYVSPMFYTAQFLHCILSLLY